MYRNKAELKRQVCSHCRHRKNYSNMSSEERKKKYDKFKVWKEKNPDIPWKRMIKRVYGITPEQYNEMLSKQGGKCSICGEENPGGRRLSIDHNHTTGQIRRLLCVKCNAGIGNFRENIALMERAIQYIKDFS